MRAKLAEHIISFILVTAGLVSLAIVTGQDRENRRAAAVREIEPFLQMRFLDFDQPLHRSLLKETLDIFYPEKTARNDSLIQEIIRYRQEQFTHEEYKSGEERGLTGAVVARLIEMYLRFLIVYLIVMVVSYHAAQSLAIFRFVTLKQRKSSSIAELVELFRQSAGGKRDSSFYSSAALLLGKAVARGAAYAVMFAPAYVIGYSVKSLIDTDSYIFLILLAVVSNGLLINYANKFFTFLVTEGRKGYTQTAVVKELSDSYDWSTTRGIPPSAIIFPSRWRTEHVFRHIFLNARYQFLPTIKEHASFIITGLIIIEMALNIHNHLGYEMLQNILYKRYDIVACIIVSIFLAVKGTEAAVDVWVHRESAKYENRSSR